MQRDSDEMKQMKGSLKNSVNPMISCAKIPSAHSSTKYEQTFKMPNKCLSKLQKSSYSNYWNLMKFYNPFSRMYILVIPQNYKNELSSVSNKKMKKRTKI